jgi:hypothetical protein
MKQTAVDFIIEKLAENGVLHSADIWMAKSIEEARNQSTWNNAIDATLKDKWDSYEQYNETFNKEV